MDALSKVVTIKNKKGLHARAASKFVKTCDAHDAQVKVTRLGVSPEAMADPSLVWTASGKSILGLMMLGAEPGTDLQIDATGAQAQQVIDALHNLIERLFDEGE